MADENASGSERNASDKQKDNQQTLHSHTGAVSHTPHTSMRMSESDSKISTGASNKRSATSVTAVTSRSDEPHSFVFDQSDTCPIKIKSAVNDPPFDTEIEINPIYKLSLKDDLTDSESSTSSSANGEEIEEVELNCPRVNCPEKIVICIDISSEMDKVSFKSRAGDKFTPMQLIKRALRIFLNTKSRLDRKHSFALVVLQESAFWMHDFTNDPNEMINLLSDLEGIHECESFDLTSLFDIIRYHVQLPDVENSAIIPPPYVVRVVLLYGRSQCVPTFTNREAQAELRESPHFFLDVFYVHEPASNENNCEKIFDVMCELDDKGFSYVLEASRNPTRLYTYLAQLTAHPLQRPLQKDASYSIHMATPQGLATQQQSQYATL